MTATIPIVFGDKTGFHRIGDGRLISAIGTDMREHVLLFCLLRLVLIAAIMLLIAPEEVTWALSLIDEMT